MVTIRLTNSKTRRKEAFEPLEAGNVRMYVCGPTVYDRAHLGNARPVVVFDVLYRLLRHVYGPDHVTYVRNFTDVDDKINAEALRRQKAGAPGTLEDLIRERTEETIAWYHADMDALGALRPSLKGVVSDRAEPRATEWVGAMVAMIDVLIAKGHAYEAEGHVLFAVDSYREHYGKLSGRTVEDMIAGARVEVAPYKRNPMDFVLWKPSSDQEPGWDSPWGRGRPGWHIECSAMAHELLGESFDIHGGGLDLQFPHHENEIAQSACAHPQGEFARYWLHNEMLQVEGKKMSKSLGNFFTVRDFLERGIPGEVIRMSFLMSHYREPMDLSAIRRREAQSIINEFAKQLAIGGLATLEGLSIGDPLPEVIEALSDDLNTGKAIEAIREFKRGTKTIDERSAALSAIYSSQRLLGFDLKNSPRAIDSAIQHDETLGIVQKVTKSREVLENYRKAIVHARESKDFAKSDELRNVLIGAGAEVQISKSDVLITRGVNFDPAKLVALK